MASPLPGVIRARGLDSYTRHGASVESNSYGGWLGTETVVKFMVENIQGCLYAHRRTSYTLVLTKY